MEYQYHYLMVMLYLITFSPPVTSQPNYHYMQYVLEWAPTFCQSNKCKPGIREEFFIHGLWPADNNGVSLPPPSVIDPKFEDRQVDNVLNADRNLKNDLQIIWPNLKAGGVDADFWKYEWRTHGLCSTPLINTADYFRAASRVHKSMIAINGNSNLLGYMVSAGIKKSNYTFYSKTNILGALSTLVGNTNDVYISCKWNGTRLLLREVYLCLDPDMKTFKSCPPNSDPRGCARNWKANNIMLPVF